MQVAVFINSRNGECFAKGTYDGKNLIVHEGGHVRKDFASHIRGGKKAKTYRNNPQDVSNDGIILCDCTFSSPSTAAQFVTGRSTNGYEAWKVDTKKSLGKYLEEIGLR